MKNKIHNNVKTKIWLPLLAIALTLLTHPASAQTAIARWTFESLPAALNYVPGAGVATTNFLADGGTQAGIAAITGRHGLVTTYGTPAYSSPAGNGSARALSSNGWTNNPNNPFLGDYYQAVVNTTGFTNIQLSFGQLSSGTGPKTFTVAYSTDGTTFTSNSATTITSSSTWTVTSLDLSSVTALANQSAVYFRLINNSTNSQGGGIVGTGGTSRIDDFLVAGTIAGPPQILTQPPNTTNFFGDTTTLTVIAGGDAPLSYQWYTNSSPILTPLADGPTGFGTATNGGTSTASLVMAFLNTNQTGDYRVVINNPLGSATSSVVHLQVNIRAPIVTNIAYIRKLHDTNFALTDTTNLYVVEGVVTTPINLVSGPTEVESFYMQDTNSGVGCNVFFRGGFPFPALGDHVKVTAPALQFNGLTELAPVNGNPAHKVEILDNNYPLPAPLYFDFTTLPTATNMEELIEGRFVVVSNVFFGVASNVSGLYTAGGTVFMTNGLGKKFNALVANNTLIDIVGTAPTATFAKSIRGVMSQSQSSGTVLTNFYSIVIAGGAYIEPGTPVTANPDAFTMTSNTTGTNSPLLNDIVLSPDASPRTLTVTGVTTTNGTVSVDSNGTNILFTPDANYVGNATLNYTATDNFGYSASGIIVVTVQSAVVNPIPLGFTFSTGSMSFTWADSSFSLQSSTNVAGPYATIPGASSGFSTNTGAAQMFFRLFHP